MSDKKQILVVEDDLSLGYLLMESLQSAGYEVQLSRDGKKAWNQYQRNHFDLCVLDVMMPEMDGFSLAHKIKAASCSTPFLFLTAKDSKEDKLKGFDLGAEDYITKPFDEDEFLCRINVALRRHQEEDSPIKYPVELGEYQFDYTKQELRYKDEMTRMTEKENEILRLLVEHQNQILKRQDAVELIYGKNDYFLGRSFDVFISRLRKHLSKDPDLVIENVFKVGFILHVKNN